MYTVAHPLLQIIKVKVSANNKQFISVYKFTILRLSYLRKDRDCTYMFVSLHNRQALELLVFH